MVYRTPTCWCFLGVLKHFRTLGYSSLDRCSGPWLRCQSGLWSNTVLRGLTQPQQEGEGGNGVRGNRLVHT